MARIVPWSLPEIAGGSQGGYTPQPTPEPVVTDYFDFSNTVFKYKYNGTTYNKKIALSVDSSDKKIIAGFRANMSNFITGIEPITLLGVSSIVVVVSGTAGGSRTTSDLKIAIDPLTYTMTFISGTYDKAATADDDCNPTSATFYVYNGNGEIIQQQEVTYS